MTTSTLASGPLTAAGDIDPAHLSIRAGLALILVICLILLTQIILKKLQHGGPRGRMRRLGIVENLLIDNKRRLVLIRRDDVEHLVLIGPEQSILVEGNIVPVGETTKTLVISSDNLPLPPHPLYHQENPS